MAQVTLTKRKLQENVWVVSPLQHSEDAGIFLKSTSIKYLSLATGQPSC